MKAFFALFIHSGRGLPGVLYPLPLHSRVKDHCSDIKRRVVERGVIAIELLPGELDIDAEMVLCGDSVSCNSFKGSCSEVVIIV